jgi:2-dehydropantoate 2-reductase
LKVLLVGAGVIGSVYGAHLAAGGNEVSVLSRGERTKEVARDSLVALDTAGGAMTKAPVRVVAADAEVQDLVLVSVRRDQLRAALEGLRVAPGRPTILVFGNNPGGRADLGASVPPEIRLGFPGIGGAMVEGVARYVRIAEQPTALERGTDPRLAALEVVLKERGFPVQRVTNMEGWLAYHATFVSCVAAALMECGIDPGRLASDRGLLDLMCRAITEGFSSLRKGGFRGLPGNLALLHHPLLRPIAVAYWASTMRSAKGELYFAAHTRHAAAEMRAIGRDVLAGVESMPGTRSLRRLLEPMIASAE